MKTRHVLFFFLLGVMRTAFAQPGSVDASLNGTGLKSFSFKQNTSEDFVTAMHQQADGKVLIAGYDSLGSTKEAFILRLTDKGALDKDFGTNGKVFLKDAFPFFLNSYYFTANAITTYNDGTIVLAGHVDEGSPVISTTPTLLSLTGSGSINTNFGGGSGGASFLAIVSGYGATFTTVQVHQATGNLLACGTTARISDFNASFVVQCVDRHGNQNTEFNSFIGYKFYSTSGQRGKITSSAVYSADSMYIAGNTLDNPPGPGFSSIAVARISMITGEVSHVFGDTVNILDTYTYPGNTCEAIALTASKDLLVSGIAYNLSDSTFLVRKLFSGNATVDLTFAGTGNAYTNINSGTGPENAYTLAVTNNGRILQGGYYMEAGNRKWVLVQLASTGQKENGFGTNGVLKINKVTDERAPYLAGLSDNTYVVIGNSIATGMGKRDIVAKKINTDGSADNSYGTASEAKAWLRDANTLLKDIVVKSDGKLLLLGNIVGNTNRAGLAQLNADGTPDTGFGGLNGADPGIAFLPDSMENMLAFAIKQVSGGKILVAGVCHKSIPLEQEDIFVMRLSETGTIDNTFNGTKGYIRIQDDTLGGADYPHGIQLQSDNKIIIHGTIHYASEDRMAVMRLNASGTFDPTFAGGKGIYYNDSSDVSEPDLFGTVKVAIQSDDKIVIAGTEFQSSGSNNDFVVQRLSKDGEPDVATFGTNGKYKHDFKFNDDIASAVALKSNGDIVAGGYASKDGVIYYALVQLKPNGNVDTTFGDRGIALYNKGGYVYQQISALSIESDRIVAMGLAMDEFDKMYATTLRFTSAGLPDETFTGQGHTVVSEGYATNAIISGSSFYIVGSTKFVEEDYYDGLVAKVKLGTGPVIKNTTLNMANLVKTYGDAPFLIRPITNSPAPIVYSIAAAGSSCATVNPTTGLVTITCATSSLQVIIHAKQEAVSGYTAKTATSTLKINKAVPVIVFPNQGGIFKGVAAPDRDTLLLSFTSNSDGSYNFTQYDGYSVIEQSGTTNKFAVVGVGEALVRVSYFGSSNYEDAFADAIVYGSLQLKLPEANADNATMIYGQQTEIVFNILSNDESFSGTIEAKQIDLDIETPGVQATYISPSLGYFHTDTLGNVTYIPFSGFIGSGSIYYTITDSKGKTSSPSAINVAVKLQGEAPSLKATEMITPNGDGLNEAFVIGFVDLEKENVLKVFDRNGQELFTQNNYNNDWRGELSNGKDAENGIYYFVFIEGSAGANQRELKGAFELKR